VFLLRKNNPKAEEVGVIFTKGKIRPDQHGKEY
jgi:hypothetical protein